MTEHNLYEQSQPTVNNAIRIPKLAHQDTIIAAAPRRVYANGNIKLK